MNVETIAAIATATSSSGIGIVRISGEEALQVIDRIFRGPKNKKKKLSEVSSHTIHYGYIYDGDEMIDEVLVMVMRGPRSYTAEDTVEIDCHGGVMVVRRVLEAVLRHGARPAEPGEFTKRAFLNGRIDLSQAEAVMDVISAKNDYARRASVSQLRGSVSDQIRVLREDILYQIAYIESALDDPEHISLEGYGEKLEMMAVSLSEKLKRLLRTADSGRIMKEGVQTVIMGKPNAGKSSLMNVLVGEERAIVTDVAGTTRDTLEEQIRMEDISLKIIDTAGIRDTDDIVEQIGVEKARTAAGGADLILFVVDASCPLDENDEQILSFIKDRKAVVLLNKTDLNMVVTAEMLRKRTNHVVIPVSAKEQTGISMLEEEIKSMFYQGKVDFNDEVYITSARHRHALENALNSIQLVEKSIQQGMPEDFYSIDLMDAYEQLGEVIGESVGEDLVNEIFSKFCTGK